MAFPSGITPSCRTSVSRYRPSRKQRRACSEPVRHELGEEPHTLRLARFPLREQPYRAIQMQLGARHPRQHRIGIADETRQRRNPEPLPHGGDLRRGVGGAEGNARCSNFTVARPVRYPVAAYHDPPEGIGYWSSDIAASIPSRRGAPRRQQRNRPRWRRCITSSTRSPTATSRTM